jgi:hypothetical protein
VAAGGWCLPCCMLSPGGQVSCRHSQVNPLAAAMLVAPLVMAPLVVFLSAAHHMCCCPGAAAAAAARQGRAPLQAAGAAWASPSASTKRWQLAVPLEGMCGGFSLDGGHGSVARMAAHGAW